MSSFKELCMEASMLGSEGRWNIFVQKQQQRVFQVERTPRAGVKMFVYVCGGECNAQLHVTQRVYERNVRGQPRNVGRSQMTHKESGFPVLILALIRSKCNHWSSLNRSVLAWQIQESENAIIGRTKEGGESQRIWNQGENDRGTESLI